ncbi:MAG TPA: ABC-2 family transporter protein [Marmoricola sp.]|nr:ABC-2 family transporter protein [Marmoricola sp.]
MRAGVRTYGRLVLSGFRQESHYRLAAFAGLVANVTFGFLKASILFATVRASGGQLQGYDVGSMSAYVWLSQGMLGMVNLYGTHELGERIRTGDIAVDVARPVDIQGAYLARFVGARVFTVIPRGLPSVAVGALTVGMTMPTSAQPYLLGLGSLLLGVAISFACVYAIHVLGFWLVETRGLQLFYMVVSGFFAGLFVPLPLFPSWLYDLAYATPFPSVMMTPVDVLSGRLVGAAAWHAVLVQVVWLAGTLLLGRMLTVAGLRRLEVQGG